MHRRSQQDHFLRLNCGWFHCVNVEYWTSSASEKVKTDLFRSSSDRLKIVSSPNQFFFFSLPLHGNQTEELWTLKWLMGYGEPQILNTRVKLICVVYRAGLSVPAVVKKRISCNKDHMFTLHELYKDNIWGVKKCNKARHSTHCVDILATLGLHICMFIPLSAMIQCLKKVLNTQ